MGGWTWPVPLSWFICFSHNQTTKGAATDTCANASLDCTSSLHLYTTDTGLPSSSAFPRYISGAHHLGWEFCVSDCFYSSHWGSHIPSSWMVPVGCVFVASIHPSRIWMSGSFESVWWNACVHRLDLGLYSHPKELLGEWSLNPC